MMQFPFLDFLEMLLFFFFLSHLLFVILLFLLSLQVLFQHQYKILFFQVLWVIPYLPGEEVPSEQNRAYTAIGWEVKPWK